MNALSLCLVVLFSLSAGAANVPMKLKQRRPASGENACPSAGCFCEPLKNLTQRCESAIKGNQVLASTGTYSDLVMVLRQLREEGQQTSLTDCPHLQAAEQCRGQLKRVIARQKPRSQHYKSNVPDELGQLGAEMMEAITEQAPRLPASSRNQR